MQYVQRVSRIRYVARKYWFEELIALLAIEAMLEVVVGRDSPDAPTLWLALPAIAILVLPIFARRRFPFAAPTAYWLLAAGISFINWWVLPFAHSLFIVGMAVAFLLGHLRNDVQAAIGLAVVVGGAVVVVYEIPGHSAAELVFVPMEFAISWLAGFAVRERAAQAEAAEERAARAEREREAAARVAVAEERARIARELHDIVAHAVSVMVLQVGAVRHKLPDALAEDRDALSGVERAGRTALAEMRRLLGAMRRDGDEAELTPQPGLDALNSLPRAIDLSAYRIVQEGLTNALKHARATNVDVTVRYRLDELQVEVRDNGEGSSTSDGLGHGLVGMRERVRIYGGEMTTGTATGGGFILSTRLPLSGDRP